MLIKFNKALFYGRFLHFTIYIATNKSGILLARKFLNLLKNIVCPMSITAFWIKLAFPFIMQKSGKTPIFRLEISRF